MAQFRTCSGQRVPLEMTDAPDDPSAVARRRKLANKRFNERIKLSVTALNAVSIGIAGSAIIIPATTGDAFVFTLEMAVWIFVSLTLHLVAQALLGLLRSED